MDFMTGLNHKDIEKIVNELPGFRMGDSFSDEVGGCWMGGGNTTDRKSLREPHAQSGQIYRFIYNKELNTIGLVTVEGDVSLSVRERSNPQGYIGTRLKKLVESYCALKTHFNKNSVKYSPDRRFEQLVIESAQIISNLT